ncbi:MAG: cytochrome c [Zymomonas mobilis]
MAKGFSCFSRLRPFLAMTTGLALAISTASWAAAPNGDDALVQKGEYLAKAADCVACHTAPNGKPFAGGLAITSPMGNIVSTNITPDSETGIGHYSEADFTRALQRGIRKDGGHLYPAMPYTAYAGLNSADIHALYLYFMKSVAPVSQKNQPTKLSFPFNIRALMMGWNLLFLPHDAQKTDFDHLSSFERGRYLADTLEHCSTCHSPRNLFMAEKKSAYLGGSPLGGWYAPNVTSSVNSGIGSWSKDDLVTYFKTGEVAGKARAGGGMAEAVSNSLSHLTDRDLHDLASYIKQVPAINDAQDQRPRDQYSAPVENTDLRTGETIRVDRPVVMDGAALYDNNCASCHGGNGNGSPDQHIPSLYNNSVIGSAQANNLVMTILTGVQRKIDGHEVFMPSFGDQSLVQRLSDKEIASLANYVTGRFGRGDAHLQASDVQTIRQGGAKPFLIRYISMLVLMGGLGILLVLSLIYRCFKKTGRKGAAS